MRKKHGTASSGPSEEAAFELGVLYQSVKNDIVAFATKESHSYTFADVATRVARLLESEALRQQYRTSELVPEMRQNGFPNRRGRPPRYRSDELGATPPLFDGSSGRRPLSRKARKAIGRAQRERWAKFHAQEDAERERWKKSSQARRDRNAKQSPETTRNLKSSAIKEFWAKLKKNPAAYKAEIAKRMKARDANKAKAAVA